jgi:hypothetical protein
MSRTSSWAKSWANSWKATWGKVSEDTPAAGGVKHKRRRPLRIGAPWLWQPPPAPLRRNRRRREAELLCFMHP